jgi:hypothetical protein
MGPAIHDLFGKGRFHQPGTNLFVTSIGAILRHLHRQTPLTITRRAPRYYPEFWFLLHLPILREFLSWNCALLLKSRIDFQPKAPRQPLLKQGTLSS